MSEKDISTLVDKYRQAQEQGKKPYFDADEFGDLAEYYGSISDLKTARKIVNIGLSIHPGNIMLLIKKAKLYAFDGEYDKALDLLSSVSDYDFDLYLLLIECHLQLDEYKLALKLTEELLEKEDNEPKDNIFSELGFLYSEANYYKEASLYFENSLKYNPENPDVLADLAYVYEMQNDYNSAIKTINRQLDIEPYNYEAWINMGKHYSLIGEYEKAVDAFDFALTINDSENDILKLKAHCLSLSGRTIEAIEIFKELLLTNPGDTSIHYSIFECFLSLEMYDQALEYLDMCRVIEGDTDEILSKQAYSFMMKEEYKKAMKIVDSGLLNSPESADLIMIKGEIELRTEKYDKAEFSFLSIYHPNEENFQLLDKLAIIQIKKEDYRQAIYYTEKMLALEPDNSAVKQRLVLIYFEMDAKERFNEMLEQLTDKELSELFELIYTPQSNSYFSREMFLSYLNKAREARILFKNLKY